MNGNTTVIQNTGLLGSYISMGISSFSVTVSTVICGIIIALITTVPSLRTPTNLLVANTCMCTLFFSCVSVINTICFYLQSSSTDWLCRIQGYFVSVALNLVIYSYVNQSISRLFWTVFYRKRFLLTMRSHVYLVIGQICLAFLLPMSILLTDHIIYRPMKLCLVPVRYQLHVCYLLAVQYVIPVLAGIILYGIIYFFVRRSTINSQRSSLKSIRDTKLARNILILLSIFVLGGIPSMFYIIISSRIESVPSFLFFIAATAPSVAVVGEKLMTLVLNRDINKVLKARRLADSTPSNRVQPFSASNPTRKLPVVTVNIILPSIHQ